MELVAHIDQCGVVDQVEALDLDRVDPGVEQAGEVVGQGSLIGDGAVDHDHLVAVAAQHGRVVADPQGGDDERHEYRRRRDGGADAAEQAEGQGGEEVGDLVLGELGGAQADDRQDAEETQTQAGSDAGGRQQESHRQHAHVDADVGGHEVLAAVAPNVQSADERDQSDQVGADGGDRCEGHGEAPWI